MGSLRNPVGPLPSSIYWRRRVVMVSVVAVLALLITWIVTSGGGGGKKNAGGPDGKNPVSTITPGPSSSGPAISQHPGGRDESGSGGSGSDSGSGSGSGSGSDGGGAGDGGSASGSGGSGSSGGGGTVGTGDALPASTTLPDCTASSLTLSVRSLHNSYSPDQTPEFQLTAKNNGSADCKTDLGPRHAVLTVTPSDADDAYWTSSDCPKSAGSLVFRVPAGQSITYTVKWDRHPSEPHCATPKPGTAKPGTYLLEAQTPGYPKSQASFVLSAD